MVAIGYNETLVRTQVNKAVFKNAAKEVSKVNAQNDGHFDPTE